MTANNRTFNKIFQNRSLWQKGLASVVLAILLLTTLAFVVVIPMVGTSSEVPVGQRNYSTNGSTNLGINLEELTPFQTALLEQTPGSSAAPTGYVGIAPHYIAQVGGSFEFLMALNDGYEYIEITADFPLWPSNPLPAGSNLTVFSGAGGPFTLSAFDSNFGIAAGRHFDTAGTLTLENVILDGTHPNPDQNNGGVHVRSGGTLIMNEGSQITNSRSSGGWTVALINAFMPGGGVSLENATLIMNDGSSITNNRSQTVGGGVGLRGASSLVMNCGSLIEGNRTILGSGRGGGVAAQSTASMVMYGTATIDDNHTSEHGGGVYFTGLAPVISGVVTTQTFTMNGGIISNNTVGTVVPSSGITASRGGGVSLDAEVNFTMNEDATITGNTTSHMAGGLFISTGLMVGANQHPVTLNPGSEISYNYAGTQAGPRTGMGGGGGIYLVSSNLVMNGGDIIHNTAWRGAGGGGIHFTGQSLGPGAQFRQHFTMNDGNISHNINHARGGGGLSIVTGNQNVYVYYNLLGGTISHNRDYSEYWRYTAGGIITRGNTRITISNTISHNRAVNGDGGGLSINGPHGGNNHVYILDGAEIVHNSAAYDGGGIYKTQSNLVQSEISTSEDWQNTLTMYGGLIAYNYARFGGGVFLEHIRWSVVGDPNRTGFHWSGAHMTFHGGEIRNNGYVTDNDEIDERTTDGGGVYVRHGSTFLATGRYASSITGNRVSRDGGGIFTESYEYEPILVECQNVKLANGQVANPNPRVYMDCEDFPYHNLNINEAVVFANNFAGRGGFLNPDNPEDTDIDFPLSGPSVLVTAGQLHTLNNYDINYRRPPMALLVKTLHVPEDTPIPNASFDFYFTPVQVQLGGSDQSRPTGDFDTLLTPNPQTVALDLSTATTATPTPANTVAVTGTLNLADLFESLEPFPLPDGVFVWNVSEVDGSSNTVLPSQMTYDLDTHFQVRVHTDSSGQVALIEVFELNYVTGNFVVGSSVESLVMSFLNTYERNIPIDTGLAIGSIPFIYFAAASALLIAVLLFSKRRKAIGKISESKNEFMTDNRLSEKVTD